MDMVGSQARVKQLLTQAHELRWFDYHRVIELSKEALVIARTMDNARWITRSLNLIGWGYNRLEQSNDSLEYAHEAIHLAKAHDLHEEYGYALVNLSFCYIVAGEVAEALKITEQLISLSEQNHFYELQTFAYNDMGIHYLKAGDFETGIRLLEKSISITEKYQLDIPKTFGYQNIAHAHLENNDIERSIEYAKRGYEEAIRTNFTRGRILSLMTLSDIHLASGDKQKAMYYAQRCYQIAKESNYETTGPLYTIANAYTAQENYEQALKIFHEIHDTISQQRNSVLSALYRNMSDIYAKQNNYQSAYEYLLRSNDAFNLQATQESEKRIRVLKTQYEIETAQREAHFQYAQDLMQQAEIEERLKRQHAEITIEKQRELMRTKSEILTRINHEFRTPLSILRMSFELLTRYQDRMNSENKEEHIRRIEEQFCHINVLLDDVLDALNIHEHTDTNQELISFNVQKLASSAITSAEQRTRTSNRVQLHIHDTPAEIYHFADSIEQIIVNLLTNAIKFSEDQVLFEVFTTPENKLVIKVCDRGIGIPPDEQANVFEILERGSNLNEIGGNGMGLALVKQNVEFLEGEIFLNSKLGGGTEFTIHLPLSPNQHNPMP
jgi:signal transduction histidine kinase